MRFSFIFLLLFFVELGGFVAFSEAFGFLSLVLEILLSGALGVLILFSTFSASNESIIEFLRGTKDPKEILASNLNKAFGAILLILPGIFTDCLGLLLQFGIFDEALISFLKRFYFKYPKSKTSEDIIEAEIIEEKEKIEK